MIGFVAAVAISTKELGGDYLTSVVCYMYLEYCELDTLIIEVFAIQSEVV